MLIVFLRKENNLEEVHAFFLSSLYFSLSSLCVSGTASLRKLTVEGGGMEQIRRQQEARPLFQILFHPEASGLFSILRKHIIWGARFHSDISLDVVKNLRLIKL
jgi:hypothetical protein